MRVRANQRERERAQQEHIKLGMHLLRRHHGANIDIAQSVKQENKNRQQHKNKVKKKKVKQTKENEKTDEINLNILALQCTAMYTY